MFYDFSILIGKILSHFLKAYENNMLVSLNSSYKVFLPIILHTDSLKSWAFYSLTELNLNPH